MRTLWTLAKFVIGLVFVVPISIIILAIALGMFGALVGLAMLTLKVAFVGLIVYTLFRFAVGLLRGRSPSPRPAEIRELPPADPHYEAAMRELDRDLGHVSR